MHLLPRRLRHAKANLTIAADERTPPDQSSGGVVCFRVALLPGESFTVQRGWLELFLVTTRFSRTVLDGYQEHNTEKLCLKVELCDHSEVHAGVQLVFSAEVPLVFEVAGDRRPTRVQWKARARFEARGYREISAATTLFHLSPAANPAPVVDGTGFLPLYEFRTEGSHTRRPPRS